MEERLFFAIWPSTATQAKLVTLATDAAQRAQARATRSATLHLTLVFLGAYDPARRQALERGAGACLTEAFSIAFDRLGCWSRNGIVWLAPSELPPVLLTLESRLRELALSQRFALDPRPYSPHITLARKARSFFAAEAVEAVVLRADRLALVRSELTREGPRYVTVKSWQLVSE